MRNQEPDASALTAADRASHAASLSSKGPGRPKTTTASWTRTTSRDVASWRTWDAPVTNAKVREVLAEGSEDDKVFWIAKIMREARYEDVWKYVSLRRDVLPRWAKIEPHLGRWQDKWRFLVEGWRKRGLV